MKQPAFAFSNYFNTLSGAGLGWKPCALEEDCSGAAGPA